MKRYLALGDSYTIGEAVEESERWPMRLSALIRSGGVPLADPEIIAVTGWTTAELSAGIDAAAPQGPFDLVTLLIGVNDQYRGLEVDEYRTGFVALLERAISLAGSRREAVLVLSIPDWGVTPFAAGRDRDSIAADIDRFNALNRDETLRAGARYLDITPMTRTAGVTSDLLAPDGLHPSGVMYAEWARMALPHALAALGASDHL